MHEAGISQEGHQEEAAAAAAEHHLLRHVFN